MRFAWLELKRFGPFTNERIEFQGTGLHVIFGLNEAGKSTTLRAIRGLLYGIPHITRDAHHHDQKSLRIAAQLVNESLEPVTFVRRKGNKNTLLDVEDENAPPLDEGLLRAMLGGVSEADFERLYWLDHTTLHTGGEQLLSDAKDAAAAFFDALGMTTSVAALGKRLDDQAAQLFKPKGSVSTLNARRRELKNASDRMDEEAINADVYADLVAQQLRLRAQNDEHRAERSSLKEAERRLVKLRSARAPFVALIDKLAKRKALGPLPHLATDFSERRKDAQRRAHDALALSKAKEDDLNRERAALASLTIDEALRSLTHEEIDALQGLETEYRSALRRLPGLRQAHEERSDAQSDQEGVLLLDPAALLDLRARTDALVLAESAALPAEAALAAEEVQANAEKSALLTRLDGVPSTLDASVRTSLETNILAARPHSDSERKRSELAQELHTAEQKLRRAALLLSPQFRGELNEALRLKGPTTDWAKQQRDLFSERKTSASATVAELERRRAERVELQGELDALEATGDVPSVQALEQARAERDARFLEIRPKAVSGTPLKEEVLDGYQDAVHHTDELADRLRIDTKRATQHATLLSQIVRIEREIASLTTQRDADERGYATALETWVAFWMNIGIEADSPEGMVRWTENYEDFRAAVGDMEDARVALQAHEGELERLARRLAASLECAGIDAEASEGLLALIARADARLAIDREATTDRARLRTEIDEASKRIEAAVREREALREAAEQRTRERETLAEALGVAVPTSARALELRIAERERTQAALLRGQELDRELRDCTAAIERFPKELSALMARHLTAVPRPSLADLEDAAIFSEAHAHLKRAFADLQKALDLEARIATLDQERLVASRALEAAHEELLRLASAAGIEDTAALEQRELEVADAARLDHEIEELRARLADDGFQDVEQLRAHLEERDAAALEQELEEIGRKERSLEEQIEPAERRLGELDAELKVLSARSAAASGEEVAALCATITEDAARYQRLVLARGLLDALVDRLRSKDGNPLVERASRFFQRLTRERYTEVAERRVDDEKPVIVAVRRDGRECSVESLSDGTRDQLYLALRLAHIAERAHNGTRMPLVLDDALVHFDDARTESALKVLSELAAEYAVQVLLFTHHRRVLELAQDAVDQELLETHELRLRDDASGPGSSDEVDRAATSSPIR